MARRAAKGTVKVNFKGVESRKTPPEGDYPMSVIEAKSSKSGNGNNQIEFVAEIAKGEYKGVKGYLYCPLQENSLWKLHAFLTALGEDVPEDEMDIDLSDLVGKDFIGVMTHETYQGRKRAKLTDFDSIENYKGSLDDDDKSDKKKKKNKDKKSKEEPAPKDKKKPAKEEKSSKKEKVKKYKSDDIEDMDEDELAAIVKKHKLDVELDDIKKLKKKQAAVVDALEGEDLIED